jgi:hypothetical protein
MNDATTQLGILRREAQKKKPETHAASTGPIDRRLMGTTGFEPVTSAV